MAMTPKGPGHLSIKSNLLYGTFWKLVLQNIIHNEKMKIFSFGNVLTTTIKI